MGGSLVMRKILSGFIIVSLLFFGLFSLTPNVLADKPVEEGNVTVTTVLANNVIIDSISAEGSYSPTNEAHGYEFVYHVVNGKVYTEVPKDGFKFHTGMEIISVFTETNKFVALFLDTNGEYLGVDYVTDNVPVGPDVTLLTKPGYKADPWGELAVINEHTIFFVNYTKTSSVKVTVNEVEYDLNEVVTLTSESPVLWLENGLPVWYGETYSFTA